ncbi:unnamed protein product [Pedinophyceae sp. YPF-701]|nr:unnamed protein product [Pedinophyceae sp. YPF-701]CAG9461415.1 unnamed protein product [Pedinophyceae sp. YPF-701]
MRVRATEGDAEPSNAEPEEEFVPMQPPLATDKPNPWKAMEVTSVGPELINGRMAMVAFVALLGAELSTHETLVQQFMEAKNEVGLLVALFTVATLVPLWRGADGKAVGPLNRQAEIWNGRAAMIGFAATMWIELNTGHALF